MRAVVVVLWLSFGGVAVSCGGGWRGGDVVVSCGCG